MDVTVYGELRAATGEKTVELAGPVETVRDALDRFVDKYPRARSQLFDEDGKVRPSVRVMCDGERVDLGAECPPEAGLQLFPAMQGGHADGTARRD
jgi:molybdopterin synthase sulfur carrier subunit